MRISDWSSDVCSSDLDSQFLTVEPDGRDDISFMDRLRHALRRILEAVHRPPEAEQAAERALQATAGSLAAAYDAGDDPFVQLGNVGGGAAANHSAERSGRKECVCSVIPWGLPSEEQKK